LQNIFGKWCKEYLFPQVAAYALPAFSLSGNVDCKQIGFRLISVSAQPYRHDVSTCPKQDTKLRIFMKPAKFLMFFMNYFFIRNLSLQHNL
jgi:hypothetical protein